MFVMVPKMYRCKPACIIVFLCTVLYCTVCICKAFFHRCSTDRLTPFGPGEHNLDVEEGSEQTIQVAEMVLHEHYVANTTDNDIALLRLAEPIRFSPYAVPACLPRRSLAEQELWAVHLHTVSGWGRRSHGGPMSRIMRKLEVPRIRTQDCVESSGVKITANMFCAGYIEGKQDSCQGDSGGPLVTRYRQTWFLLGIVSWGKGCARPGNYGIYTRVSNYLDWIHQHTARPAGNGTDTTV